jgi:predicted transcriptional regulator
MKTAVSVPDDLFRQADRLAKRQRKSRSRLYSEAIGEYVARHDPDWITEQLNNVADTVDTSADEFAMAAVYEVLKRKSSEGSIPS